MESSPVKIISGAATGAAHKLAPAGTGTGAAAGTSGGKTAAPPSCGHPAKHMDACIEACRNCERVCLDTIPHCLGKGGHHARADHIMLLMNCAAICATSARFMISGSHLHVYTCAACKEVCAACADDCAGMLAGGEGADDPMVRCVAACRDCATSCADMACARA
ncbi:hypothetical protein CHLRE_17g701600v5 [Chlamydomonas reinhardtii]|uniref:Ferredoxin n=1 Tax=Chlamydomonas reinhardtii TaxID=3055 RepID=A0A2K3CNY8_CHLRE|nr:uncharacterized protein CHLRE_17g701600v5 [Chlamydomonas reinhardtii]PNW70001.1 hypothetical protein CHLRE_17g701600v5 [Chlamydomonas reinhardtii]